MYGQLVKIEKTKLMDQSDIKYVLELLNDAVTEKDWDDVEEARETLKEFLDIDSASDDE